MKLFYGDIIGESVTIDAEEQQHIAKVLRMKEGDELYVTDGKGSVAKGNLYFEGKKALLNSIEIQHNTPEFPFRLHVAIAPTKNMDRIDFFVEKATEMGIAEISFLQTDKTERKHMNIEKIIKQSVAASKQSHRFHFPKINEMVKFSDFIKNIYPEKTFVAHCDSSFGRILLSELNSISELTILIGPEGDFSAKEIQQLSDIGVKAISLGSQRLRTETAGVFVSAWNYTKSLL
ncbi:MAG: 16S rRNA (uracil(1498)-N(3))-methyltransferase [Bacteroidetes bacterium]|nr:16S rRNA (uracil(1498)-N(3))-methyltransferase [Bacteroidota bacterium]